MKQLQLLKHFREHGCVLHRAGAKHSVYQNTRTGKRTTVPRHCEIDNITVCNEWSNSQ